MINQYHYEEYIDNRDTHEDYYTVMEEYSGTELFNEILHFMDIAFPEWKSNKGLGFWAGEFMLTILLNTSYLEDREEYTQREMLINLYSELTDEYHNTKERYKFVFNQSVIETFEVKYELDLEEKEHLPFEEYSVFYDELFDKHKTQELEKITYNFEDELIY